MTLPNFLIVGANKAGTTSLHEYLKQHPQILMSPIKEPMFFVWAGRNIPDDSMNRMAKKKEIINNIDSYKKLFLSDKRYIAIGESSTAYMTNPNVPDNIKKLIPKMKIIAIIRNPIERAYSHYRMFVKERIEVRSFMRSVIEELEKPEIVPLPQRYLKRGFYSDNLIKYRNKFGPENVKIILFETFVNKTSEVLKEIYCFLNVDATFRAKLGDKFNVGIINDNYLHIQNRIIMAIYRKNPKKLAGLRVVEFIERYFTNHFSKTQLTPPLRRKLIDYYKPEILNLEKITKLDLRSWTL